MKSLTLRLLGILTAAILVGAGLIALAGCSSDDNGVAPNSPPTVPVIDTANGAPADSTLDAPLDPILMWTCSDPDGDPLEYDVYFGYDADPPIVGTHQTQTDFATIITGYGIRYHWRVVARDSHGNETSSPVWTFRIRSTS